MSRSGGTFICFNPACSQSGTIIDLIKFTTKRDEFGARRLLLKSADSNIDPFADQLIKALEKPDEFVYFPADFKRMQQDFWNYPKAVDYMKGRGFERETLEFFEIGYSKHKRTHKEMIVVPMHDPHGMPIGLIGRSLTEKSFQNSRDLPKSITMWNLHRAKRESDTVIVCEASFDAMRIHQAGYPNVVALLGGSLSPKQYQLFDRHFNNIVIMTDFDEKIFYERCAKCAAKDTLCVGHNAGRDLGDSIDRMLYRKNITWASYKFGEVYPRGAKDAGDLTDDEIRQCISNAVSSFEYRSWSLY